MRTDKETHHGVCHAAWLMGTASFYSSIMNAVRGWYTPPRHTTASVVGSLEAGQSPMANSAYGVVSRHDTYHGESTPTKGRCETLPSYPSPQFKEEIAMEKKKNPFK